MTERDDLLHEVIEGRLPQGRLDPEMGRMVRIAAISRRIELPGPSAAAVARMDGRFEAMLEGRQARTPVAWLLGWLGAGPRPRTLAQRFAAATVALAATTTTAGAVTGNTPLETAVHIAEFTGSAIQNLNPARLDGGGDTSPATPEPTADANSLTTQTATPDASSPTPAPSTTGTPTGTATPTPGQQPGAAVPATPPAPADGTPTPGSTDVPTATSTPTPPAPSPSATGTPDDGLPTTTPTPPSPTPPTTPTSTPTTTPSPTPTATPTPSGESFSAGDAGTVTLRKAGKDLQIVSVQPASGWTVTKQQTSGDEVEIELVKGSRKVEFKAQIEDGVIKVHVDEESVDGESDGGDG